MRIAIYLKIKELAKGRLLHCKKRPFSLQFTAFCKVKDGKLRLIRKSFG